MRELPELEGGLDGTIKFDKDICCALERAVNQNPKTVKRLEDIIDNDDEVAGFKGMLSHPEIDFEPSEDMKMFYSQLATKELDRIDAEGEKEDDLICGHSTAEHQDALKMVVDKMGAIIH